MRQFQGTNPRQLVVSLGQQWLQLQRTDSGGVCGDGLVLELYGIVRFLDRHVSIRNDMYMYILYDCD